MSRRISQVGLRSPAGDTFASKCHSSRLPRADATGQYKYAKPPVQSISRPIVFLSPTSQNQPNPPKWNWYVPVITTHRFVQLFTWYRTWPLSPREIFNPYTFGYGPRIDERDFLTELLNTEITGHVSRPCLSSDRSFCFSHERLSKCLTLHPQFIVAALFVAAAVAAPATPDGDAGTLLYKNENIGVGPYSYA